MANNKLEKAPTIGSGTSPENIDLLIALAKNDASTALAFQELPTLENSSHFRKVVEEFSMGNSPPVFVLARQGGCVFEQRERIHAVGNLAWFLLQARIRIQMAKNSDFSAWDRHWINVRKQFEEKKKQLEDHLRQAADIMSMGHCESEPYPSLDRYFRRGNPIGSHDVNEVHWCGADNLRRWADVVNYSPVEVVFPKARPLPEGWLFRPDSMAKRGGGTCSEGHMRGFLIRELAQYVPEQMLTRGRGGYAAIARLLVIVGMKVSPQQARGVILKGRT